jgi:hypothetical protein
MEMQPSYHISPHPSAPPANRVHVQCTLDKTESVSVLQSTLRTRHSDSQSQSRTGPQVDPTQQSTGNVPCQTPINQQYISGPLNGNAV